MCYNPDVAAGLKTHSKFFGEKGLKGLYPKGENVDRLVMYYGSICHSLGQQGSLPEDAIANVLKGLSLASHEGFAKLFKDFEITLKNPLLNVKLEVKVMDHIVGVMDTTLTQYMPYSLSGQWMALLAHHTNKMSTPPPGFKCDNFGNPNFMNQCPKYFDDERITCNWKACGAPPINHRGSDDGGNGGCDRSGIGGQGGGGGRGCGGGGGGDGGGNCGQGNFSSPAKNDRVLVVDGKACAACKYCGWNSGNCAQMTGSHNLSRMSGYSVTFALNTNINELLVADDSGRGGDSMNDSVGGDDEVNSFAATMMERCFIIEKEYSDPENAAFTGRFGGFLQYLAK